MAKTKKAGTHKPGDRAGKRDGRLCQGDAIKLRAELTRITAERDMLKDQLRDAQAEIAKVKADAATLLREARLQLVAMEPA